MSRPDNKAPQVNYRTNRLVGVELEMDHGSNARGSTPPPAPAGWTVHPDGSIAGKEYVLEVPKTLGELPSLAQSLCAALQRAKCNPHKAGSLHVHIQAHDYTVHTAENLTWLYTKFKDELDGLVGYSRRAGRSNYCLPYDLETYKDQLSGFSLNALKNLPTRADAKQCCGGGGRPMRYYAVNFSMLHVAEPLKRSIEFRQGSATTRHGVITGWTALLAALTDFAFDETVMRTARRVKLTRLLEEVAPDSNLHEWVKWRHDYLTKLPVSRADAGRLLSTEFSGKTGGIYSAARALNCSLPVANKALEQAVQDGFLAKTASGRGYVSAYSEFNAAEDVDYLLRCAQGA